MTWMTDLQVCPCLSTRLRFKCLRFADSKHHKETPEDISSPHENVSRQDQLELEDPASGLTNPLSTGPPAFTIAENGRACM